MVATLSTDFAQVRSSWRFLALDRRPHLRPNHQHHYYCIFVDNIDNLWMRHWRFGQRVACTSNGRPNEVGEKGVDMCARPLEMEWNFVYIYLVDCWRFKYKLDFRAKISARCPRTSCFVLLFGNRQPIACLLRYIWIYRFDQFAVILVVFS